MCAPLKIRFPAPPPSFSALSSTQTIDPDDSDALAGVDLRELDGPSTVPAGLHASAPTTLDGLIDWSRAEALAIAVDALLAGGLVAQARPLASELRMLIEGARGARATVVELSVERAKRET